MLLVEDPQSRDNDRRTILNWLSPELNFWIKQRDFLALCKEGTGEWLLDHPEFEKWLSGTNSTLWCPGIRMSIPSIFTQC